MIDRVRSSAAQILQSLQDLSPATQTQTAQQATLPDAPAPATFLGRAVQWIRTQVASFASMLGELFGLNGGSNVAATGAQVGAARGRIASKGAVLAGHVLDAQARYGEAKKALTTSITYAEAAGRAEAEQAKAQLPEFDRRADEIFERIANRHRSGTSRQNQRAKLETLAGEMSSLARTLDRLS